MKLCWLEKVVLCIDTNDIIPPQLNVWSFFFALIIVILNNKNNPFSFWIVQSFFVV